MVIQTTNPRKPKQNRLFSIVFKIEGTDYSVIPLRGAHPEVALKAFRMKKRDAQGNVVACYDVHLTPEGHIECECPGHLRHGHCRHQETLQAAGMLPVSASSSGDKPR